MEATNKHLVKIVMLVLFIYGVFPGLLVSSEYCKYPDVPKYGSLEWRSRRGEVEHYCDPGYELSNGSIIRKCLSNGEWSGNPPKCKDIDECKTGVYTENEANRKLNVQNDAVVSSEACHKFATCINTPGSYICKCKHGYDGDTFDCEQPFKKKKVNKRRRKHKCGVVRDTSPYRSRYRRIVGGSLATKGSFPWQVAINYQLFGKTYLFNGVLIKPNWVLTVANIFRRHGKVAKPQKVQVVLGEFDRNKIEGSEVFAGVKRIITHPDYDRYTLRNNIALLELDKPAQMNEFTSTICLPRHREEHIESTPYNGVIAGWGARKRAQIGGSTGPLSKRLRQVTLPIAPNKVCDKATIYPFDSTSMLCAGHHNRKKAPCNGDIGSPFIAKHPSKGRWIVIGLFAWSEGCGQEGKYSYYTRVSKYRRWIANQTQDS